MMYWYGSGIGGWGYALMAIGMVLFWGAAIFGIVALFRYAGRSGLRGSEHHEPASPERLLAERFARGEIDEEEYQRRLAALQVPGQRPVFGRVASGASTRARTSRPSRRLSNNRSWRLSG